MLRVHELVVAGDHDPADVADQLELPLAEVSAALADCSANPTEMRAVRRADEATERELADRSVEPPTIAEWRRSSPTSKSRGCSSLRCVRAGTTSRRRSPSSGKRPTTSDFYTDANYLRDEPEAAVRTLERVMNHVPKAALENGVVWLDEWRLR